MKNFALIASGIDVSALREQVVGHPELWNAHKNRMALPSNPFDGTDDIWVRYNDLARAKPNLAGFTDEHVPVWYPAWDVLTALKPIIFDLMAKVQGEMLGGVLITRVPDGAEIKPHVDRGWHVEYFSKYYISIDSAPGATFFCRNGEEDEGLDPMPGECWLFDNKKLHWVKNTSGKARVTLIVCIRRPPCRLRGPQEPPL